MDASKKLFMMARNRSFYVAEVRALCFELKYNNMRSYALIK